MNTAATQNLADLDLVLAQAEALLMEAEKLAAKIAYKRGRDKRRYFKGLIRLEIAERDGHKCRYCGVQTFKGQVDHVIPWSKGGRTNALNAAWSCAGCNRAKSNKVW